MEGLLVLLMVADMHFSFYVLGRYQSPGPLHQYELDHVAHVGSVSVLLPLLVACKAFYPLPRIIAIAPAYMTWCALTYVFAGEAIRALPNLTAVVADVALHTSAVNLLRLLTYTGVTVFLATC